MCPQDSGMLHISHHWLTAIAGFVEFMRAAGLPNTTISSRKQHIEHLARRVIAEPWRLTFEQLLEYVGRQQWAPETRRGRRSTFCSFWAYGLEAGLTDTDITAQLPKVKPGKPAPRPVPEPVYREALGMADERLALILRLAHDLGLRRGEIAQIHSRDIFDDLTGWSLRVRGKGAKLRIVPLTARLALELRSLPVGWAFPGDLDGHLSPRWVGRMATALLPTPHTLHGLRHSFASRAYQHDRDLLAVQELLGHASPATTRVYVVVPKDALRRTVEAIA